MKFYIVIILAIAIFLLRTFNLDIDYYINAETVRKTELKHYKEMLS